MAETIGTLVDKLSIAHLKLFYMRRQTERTDATVDHRERCKQRVVVLEEQIHDLREELKDLTEAVKAGKRKLKVYRQFKMYNDPSYRSAKELPSKA